MGMSLKEIDKLIEQIAAQTKFQERAQVVLSTPDATLVRSLGPLTAKMAKTATIRTAVALNYALGKSTPGQIANTESLRNAADNLSGKIFGSANYVGSSGVSGVIELIKQNDAIKITGAIEDTKKALPDVSQDAIYAKLIDAALATAVTAIPFVGPILASACTKGINGLFSGAGSAVSGQLGANFKNDPGYNSNIKAGTTWQMGGEVAGVNALTNLSAGIDFGKDTPGSIIVKLIQDYRENQRKETLKGLTDDPSKKAQWESQFSRILNPLAQNQVAQNTVIDNFKFKINSSKFVGAETALENCLSKTSATATQYISKVSEALQLAAAVVQEVITASIVGSFAEEIVEYKQILNANNAYAPAYYPATNRDADHMALIIIAYFMNISMKTNKSGTEPFYQFFLDTKTNKILDGGVWRNDLKPQFGPKPMPVSFVRDVDPSSQDLDAADFLDRRSKFKAATTRALNVYSDDTRFFQVLKGVETESTEYVRIIKDSMTRGMTKALFRFPNNDIKQIVITFAACNVIVNSVLKAGIKGKMEKDFDIPFEAVSALADSKWGFVNVYSTWNKRIDDKDKIAKIGAEVKTNQSGQKYVDWNVKGAKLRWYNDRLKGGSSSEKAMMYLFAKGATSNINLFNLFTGAESWERTKESLHGYIALINRLLHGAEAKNVVKK